ncbi:MAG: adenylate kinase [Nocardioidaceae bacterium]|jgi:adenylate kinase
MKLLLIGPPGSGKGTQGVRLSERFGVEHIAAGDLLRHEVETQTPLGQQVADYLDRGELVPDQLIIDLVMPKVLAAAAANGYVLDGFPRSVGQAVEARRLAEREDSAATAAVFLDAPEDELADRLLKRAMTEGRSDDTAEVIHTRLRVFNEVTQPLLDFYADRGLLHVVDATKSVDDVTAAIIDALENAGRPAQ